jgi:uncharacterized membrane protein YdjX (TVP38/TMEM64 family)
MTVDFLKQISGKEIAAGIGIALLFLTASFFSERFASVLRTYIGAGGAMSMAAYVGTVVVVVLVPFATSLPLIPVAVSVWGGPTAALLTLSAWVIGASIAFMIARRFGAKFVTKFVSLEALRQASAMVPKRNLAVGTIFFAMFGAPADILSYALGLFTHIRAATAIVSFSLGFSVFAFFITYTATLPIIYQTYMVGFMLLAWFFMYARLKYNAAQESGIARGN